MCLTLRLTIFPRYPPAPSLFVDLPRFPQSLEHNELVGEVSRQLSSRYSAGPPASPSSIVLPSTSRRVGPSSASAPRTSPLTLSRRVKPPNSDPNPSSAHPNPSSAPAPKSALAPKSAPAPPVSEGTSQRSPCSVPWQPGALSGLYA